MPVISMMMREVDRVSGFCSAEISLLTLKPTSDKNVDAEDSAAAIIPASKRAPRNEGTKFFAAQIITVSDGEIAGLAMLIRPPIP